MASHFPHNPHRSELSSRATVTWRRIFHIIHFDSPSVLASSVDLSFSRLGVSKLSLFEFPILFHNYISDITLYSVTLFGLFRFVNRSISILSQRTFFHNCPYTDFPFSDLYLCQNFLCQNCPFSDFCFADLLSLYLLSPFPSHHTSSDQQLIRFEFPKECLI